MIEAITYVTRSCPHGAVVSAAERALDAIQKGGSEVLRQQAYFVLTSIQGWRGDRARQVHRSLSRYLESPELESPELESPELESPELESSEAAPDPATPAPNTPNASRPPQSRSRS